MRLKKTDAMQRFCLIRHSLVLMTSHTPVLTPPLLYIFLPVVYTQESQGMLKFILSFVRAEKIISLYLEKKQTHFASEELLKQPLCAVFFYALILFPTLSWLISIPRQIPYIKRFCINQEPIVQVLTQQTEDSSPRALDLRSSPRKETWVEFGYFKKILSSSSVVNDDCLRHFSS